jgi:hypothetical protein
MVGRRGGGADSPQAGGGAFAGRLGRRLGEGAMDMADWATQGLLVQRKKLTNKNLEMQASDGRLVVQASHGGRPGQAREGLPLPAHLACSAPQSLH